MHVGISAFTVFGTGKEIQFRTRKTKKTYIHTHIHAYTQPHLHETSLSHLEKQHCGSHAKSLLPSYKKLLFA
jgi:hypothetical protein